MPQNSLRWRIWTGDNQYLFFEDDGISNSGQNQNYSLREIRVYTQENQIVVDIVPRVGDWIPPEREVIVEVVGIGEQRFTDDGGAYIFRF